eukprot:746912-Hanusia_phi.AAC.2
MSDARNSNLSSGLLSLLSPVIDVGSRSGSSHRRFEVTGPNDLTQPTNGFLFITLSVGNQGNVECPREHFGHALDVDINDIVSSFLQARASIDLSFGQRLLLNASFVLSRLCASRVVLLRLCHIAMRLDSLPMEGTCRAYKRISESFILYLKGRAGGLLCHRCDVWDLEARI